MPVPFIVEATVNVQSTAPALPNELSAIVIISPASLFLPGLRIAVTVAAPVPSTTIVYVPGIKSDAILFELPVETV